jgi:hypothetical protein
MPSSIRSYSLYGLDALPVDVVGDKGRVRVSALGTGRERPVRSLRIKAARCSLVPALKGGAYLGNVLNERSPRRPPYGGD